MVRGGRRQRHWSDVGLNSRKIFLVLPDLDSSESKKAKNGWAGVPARCDTIWFAIFFIINVLVFTRHCHFDFGQVYYHISSCNMGCSLF